MNRPSMSAAIKAKCKDCMDGYHDGRLDCAVPSCSLYYWMPYRDRSGDAPKPKVERTAAQLAATERLLASRSTPKTTETVRESGLETVGVHP